MFRGQSILNTDHSKPHVGCDCPTKQIIGCEATSDTAAAVHVQEKGEFLIDAQRGAIRRQTDGELAATLMSKSPLSSPIWETGLLESRARVMPWTRVPSGRFLGNCKDINMDAVEEAVEELNRGIGALTSTH